MEHIKDAMEMVDLISQPAFCVKEGVIVKVNPIAAGWMVQQDTQIATLVNTGWEEYQSLETGTLYLTLNLSGQILASSVTRKSGFDLFLVDENRDYCELRALALAARELREPLSDIMVTTSRLQSEDPVQKDQIRRMNRNLYRMLRLVGNMSDAARYAESGAANQEIRDLRAIVSETAAKAGILSERAGIYLEQELYPEPIFCLLDQEKLERAIFNMLSNAIKFTPGGERVQLMLNRRDNKAYLSVQDSGCGIPDSLRSQMFQRYTREPVLEDSRYGIGLGFVMIRSAAIAHGGTVLVDHPNGTGTRITLCIPIHCGTGQQVRSPILRVDYAGEMDHGLLEFSELLPYQLYDPSK